MPSAIPASNKASKPESSRFIQRDPRAHLSDILEAAAAIQEATSTIDEAGYGSGGIGSVVQPLIGERIFGTLTPNWQG